MLTEPLASVESARTPDMLAVHLDESYSVPSAMVVGGVVSTESEVQSLQEAWSRVLKEECLDFVGFADILGGRGRYREWSQDRREALIERFVDLIQAHSWCGLCSVVAFEDIDAVMADDSLSLDEGDKLQFAYQLCGLACIAWASEFIAREGLPRVTIVLEKGMRGFGAIRDLARAIADERIILPQPRDKRDLPLLQAADFMASAFNRFARPITSSSLPEWRPHAGRRRLVARMELNGVWYSREAIKRVAGYLQPFASSRALREAYGIVARS